MMNSAVVISFLPTHYGYRPQVDAATRCMRAAPQALEQEQTLGKQMQQLEESLKVCGELCNAHCTCSNADM